MRAWLPAFVVSLVLPATAAAVTPRAGHWSGQGDHLLVDFMVDNSHGERVLDVLFQYKNVRPECEWTSAVSFGNAAIINGRFEIRRGHSARPPLIRGVFSRTGAHGIVSRGEHTNNGCPQTVYDWTAHLVSDPFLADGAWTGNIGGLPLSFDITHGGRVIRGVRGELTTCDGQATEFRGRNHSSIIEANNRFRIALSGLDPSLFYGTFFSDAASAQGYVRRIPRTGCDSDWRFWSARPRA